MLIVAYFFADIAKSPQGCLVMGSKLKLEHIVLQERDDDLMRMSLCVIRFIPCHSFPFLRESLIQKIMG